MARETTEPTPARHTAGTGILGPPRVSRQRLAELQKVILRWLHAEAQRRRQLGQAVDIAYPELVRGLKVNKAEVAIGLRHLMRQGLVSVSLPRGAWTRYVHVTAQGNTQATSLSKQERQQHFKQYVTTVAEQDHDEHYRRRRMGSPSRRRKAQHRRSTWE